MLSLRLAAGCALLLVGVGCGGGGTTEVITPPPASVITVSVVPTSLSVQQGATGSVRATVQRVSISAAPTVSVDGLPAGVTVTTTAIDESNFAIGVEVASTVPVGPYTATVHATAGSYTATATYALTITDPPNFSLTSTANALNITAGTTGTSTIGATRSGGFSSDVALTLSSAQSGITGTFTPPTISTGTSALVVSVASTVAAGTYTATVTGTAGTDTRTVPLTITVAAAPRIAVALDPTSLTLAFGSQGTTTVNLVRTNFTGPITFVASGQPSGIAVTFNTSPTTTSTSVATIVVDATVPIGNYPIVISATGVNAMSGSATLNVAVQPPNTEFRYCTEVTSELPVWFAYQDGSGAWTRVNSTISGSLTVYRFQISAAVGAIAVVAPAQQVSLRASRAAASGRSSQLRTSPTAITPAPVRGAPSALSAAPFTPANAGAGSTTLFRYGTREELIALGATGNCGASGATARNFTGTIANADAGQSILVELGGSYASKTGNTAFSLFDVALGNQSLFAGAKNAGSDVFTRYVLMRDITTAGGVLPLVDFTGTGSFAPATSTMTVQNALGDTYNVSTDFYVQPGSFSVSSNSLTTTTTSALPFSSVPTALRRSGEFDDIAVSTDNSVGYNGENRFANVMQSGPLQPLVAVLGARLPETTITFPSLTPYPRPRLQNTVPVDYGANVEFRINQVNDFSFIGNDVRFVLTTGYRAAIGIGTNVDITMPDLSAVAGFPLASLIPRGSRVILATTAENIEGGFGVNPVYVAGARYINAGRRQDITY